MDTAPLPPTPRIATAAPWIALDAPPPDIVMVVSRLVGGAGVDGVDALLEVLAGPAGATIPLGDGGATLHLCAPVVTAIPGRRHRHVRGHLRWGGLHVIRRARVEVDVERWSDEVVEVSLRPLARSAASWGPRRLRRWFRMAHLAGDVLEHRLRILVAADRAARAEAERAQAERAEAERLADHRDQAA